MMKKAKTSQFSVAKFQTQIFSWWRQHGRILPWREKEIRDHSSVAPNKELSLRDQAFDTYFASTLRRDPYRVVVSEMMLQQTQVDRVYTRYLEWMQKWPTITDLAQASLAEVLIFWQGLGYNRRARFLWLLAQEIVHKRQGVWPQAEVELRRLPGIGQYTARAILSFAFGQQVGVVDTNVKRIYYRIAWGGETEAEQSHSEKAYIAIADQCVPPSQADPWNQALMDFGALVCTSRSPKCSHCPLQKLCRANLNAQAKGYETYAMFLTETVSLRPKSGKQSVKFVETDRYFRGRIMDELRSTILSVPELQQRLHEQYGLGNRERFDSLLQDLQDEGLISVIDGQVKIG